MRADVQRRSPRAQDSIPARQRDRGGTCLRRSTAHQRALYQNTRRAFPQASPGIRWKRLYYARPCAPNWRIKLRRDCVQLRLTTKAGVAGQRGNLRGFTARCGAEVEHLIPRLRRQKRDGRRRGRLLRIKRACMIERQRRHFGICRRIKRERRKRRLHQCKRQCAFKLIFCAFYSVQTNAAFVRFVVRRPKRRIFCPKHILHSFFKSCGQFHGRPTFPNFINSVHKRAYRAHNSFRKG